jgi:hypothetical protein
MRESEKREGKNEIGRQAVATADAACTYSKCPG